jgi:hypothetical protein
MIEGGDIFLDIKRRNEESIAGESGGSFSGKTAGSGPANRGSNPRPPATMVPSSSGLGRRPLTPVTRVRVPLGLSRETQPLDFPQYSRGFLSLVLDGFRPFWAQCAQKNNVLNTLPKGLINLV